MKYKLLIVDDEFLTIEGLKNTIDWSSYNIRIIGEAYNGKMGIESAKRHTPDIIITDVKMPDMDGLTMIKAIKDINPNTRFIVLSGYDRFDWAKEAFHYGVADYLVKPVDLENLDRLLKKLIKEIEADSLEEIRQKKIENILTKSVSSIRKDTIEKLLTGQYSSMEAMEEMLSASDIALYEKRCMVFVIKLLQIVTSADEPNVILPNIQGWLESNEWGYGSIRQANEMACLINARDVNEQWCSLLAEHINNKFSLEEHGYKIGIGQCYSDLNRIKLSYIEAQEALKYHYLIKGNMVQYREVRLQKHLMEKIDYPAELEKDLIDALKLADYEKLNQLLTSYSGSISKKKIDIALFKNLATELLFNVKRGLNNINIDYSEIFVNEYDEINKINDMNNIEDILSGIYSIFEQVINYVQLRSNNENKLIVQDILDYIDKNYSMPDLTIAKIAEKVYLTPNYVSLIIKQVMGENFRDILTNKRIEKAKDLMFDLSLKTYEISDRTGFGDANYFSKVFKKTVGMTPLEFRNKFCK